MSQVTRYECDVCGRASNGDLADWFAVRGVGGDATVDSSKPTTLELERLRGQANHYAHVCGHECAVKLISRRMRDLR